MNKTTSTQTRPSMIMLLALFAIAAVLSACSGSLSSTARAQNGDQDLPVTVAPYVIAEGRLVPKDSSWLSFSRAGKVVEILVEEGQQVEKGQVLARLGDREQAGASLAAAELELLDAQQTLDALQRTAALSNSQSRSSLIEADLALIDAQEAWAELDLDQYQEDMDEAWKKVLESRDALKDAQEEFDKYRDMNTDNTNRKNAEQALEDAQDEYAQTLRDYNRLKNNLDQARINLTLAEERFANAEWDAEQRQNGAHAEDLALAQARLKNAQAQVQASQAALDYLELVAPYAGAVVEIEMALEEWTAPDLPAVLIADFSEWYVETTDLSEVDVVRVDTSKGVLLKPDALPQVELRGVIEKTSDVYMELRGDILYQVRIRVEEMDPRLRWGMTVQVQFEELER